MKAVYMTCVLLGLACQAFAFESEDFGELEQDQGRFLYFNSSSSASSLALLGAVILFAVVAYLIFGAGLFGSAPFGQNKNSYDYSQQYQYDNQAYQQYRGLSPASILEWIHLLQQTYEGLQA